MLLDLPHTASLSRTLLLLALFGAACSNPERCFDASCATGGTGGVGAAGAAGGSGPGGDGPGGSGTGANGGAPAGVQCGDGIVEGGELCDGDDFDGKSCASLGLPPSRLLCYGDCTLNAAFCGGTCNGAMKDPEEACDGLPSAQCEDLVAVGVTGSPLCSPLCLTHDTSTCDVAGATCGNGTVEAPEQCDLDASATSCVNLGFVGGTVACHPNCSFDTRACHRCGDGVINPGEQCDGTTLGPTTCESLNYAAGGTLGCNPDCSFDASACITCGNGTRNVGEDCDGADFGGLTCEDFGFSSGDLSCDDACVRSTAGCS